MCYVNPNLGKISFYGILHIAPRYVCEIVYGVTDIAWY